ncbi:MAG: cytochrome c maturation protein CcmE [Steroidobacteraceae bacterium]
MTPRRRRLLLVVGLLGGVALAGGLALSALRNNVMFYFVPTQVAEGKAPVGQTFRLGGMVAKGSVYRTPGTLEVHFRVTDYKHEIPVEYTGVLPDLFRADSGVIVQGKLLPDGVFRAEQVLAKHDQYYRPPGIHPKWGIDYGDPRDPSLAVNADDYSGSRGVGK